MIKSPPIPDEAGRLAALQSYGVLDTPAEKDFDDLVDLAAHLCGTPIALVSLVDKDRQWFKAAYGLSATETPRDISFCGHTILKSEMLVVPDATRDERFADNPLVMGELGVRFYAGAPLMSPEGQALGALCVMDRQPRELTKVQKHALSVLSHHVMAQLELRRHARELSRINEKLRNVLEEERRAEAVARETEELNHAVLNSVLAHIAVLDGAGKIIAVNDAWREFAEENFGTTDPWARTDVGTNYLEACRTVTREAEAPAEAGKALSGLEAVLRGERDQFTLEYTCHAPDGQRWFLLSATPLKSRGGGAVVSHLDITKRKCAEEQLLQKTALLEASVNSAVDGALIVDAAGKKILQNQRMAELWQIPREIAEDPDDRRQLEWCLGQVKDRRKFAEGVAYLYAHPDEVGHDEIELANGTILDRYTAPARGEDGRSYGRSWTFRDITERRQAMQQIADQAAYLDKARDAIVVRDLEGKVLFWNKGAEQIYGWKREEVVGLEINRMLYADPRQADEIAQHTLRLGEWSGEVQHRTQDRGEITVEASWTLIRDNAGNPKSVLAINTDVTEKKQIEAQYMRAQRMESLGTLAGGIAHDLNNILAPIMMSIDILKQMSPEGPSTEILDTIEVSAKRGADIVRQVLSFARGLEGQRVEIQPKHLIRELEKIIKDTFPKDIRLHFEIPREVWTILGDPTQVHQVLLNLCVNARDAMPNGGTLAIEIQNCELDAHYAAMNLQSKPGHYVKISVIDSGSGIPPELLDKIFEPFFTTKELNKGTGLGLSTVMTVVKSHGGIINVYSEVDRGSTFNVYLPAAQDSTAAGSTENAEANLPRGNGETILVVDDEASLVSITNQTLKTYGYKVLTAVDGAEAVAVYAPTPGQDRGCPHRHDDAGDGRAGRDSRHHAHQPGRENHRRQRTQHQRQHRQGRRVGREIFPDQTLHGGNPAEDPAPGPERIVIEDGGSPGISATHPRDNR